MDDIFLSICFLHCRTWSIAKRMCVKGLQTQKQYLRFIFYHSFPDSSMSSGGHCSELRVSLWTEDVGKLAVPKILGLHGHSTQDSLPSLPTPHPPPPYHQPSHQSSSLQMSLFHLGNFSYPLKWYHHYLNRTIPNSSRPISCYLLGVVVKRTNFRARLCGFKSQLNCLLGACLGHII